MPTEVILAAWCLSVVVLFLPVGRVSKFAWRRLRPATPDPGELPAASEEPQPADAEAPSLEPAPEEPLASDLEESESNEPDPESLPFTTGKQLLGVARWLTTVALYGVFILGTVYLAPRAMERALNTDHPIAAITSQSMYPALKRGDMVIMEGVDKVEDLKVGDIISFPNPEGTHLLIHRIVLIDGDEIVTQGDTRDDFDEPITFDDVQGRAMTIGGRLAKIPYLGNLTILFGSTSDPDADQEPSRAPDELVSDDLDAAPPPLEEPPVRKPPNDDRSGR